MIKNEQKMDLGQSESDIGDPVTDIWEVYRKGSQESCPYLGGIGKGNKWKIQLLTWPFFQSDRGHSSLPGLLMWEVRGEESYEQGEGVDDGKEERKFQPLWKLLTYLLVSWFVFQL